MLVRAPAAQVFFLMLAAPVLASAQTALAPPPTVFTLDQAVQYAVDHYPTVRAALERIRAPTLLIVGAKDKPVIALNEEAYARLPCEKALRIVPGASHLFEEEGALELVAQMASEWFADRFQPHASTR